MLKSSDFILCVFLVTYNWQCSSAFPTCPTTCGLTASIVSRTVQCLNSLGAIVDDDMCALIGTKPAVSITCPATPACGNWRNFFMNYFMSQVEHLSHVQLCRWSFYSSMFNSLWSGSSYTNTYSNLSR